MQLRMKLGAVALAGSAATFVLAGTPTLASSHAAKTITGPEVIAGAVHGKKALANPPRIPLRWRGLVHTHSVIVLNGRGPHKGSVLTLPSRAGNLTVRVTRKPQSREVFNNKTCRGVGTEDIVFKVVGNKSTGAFAGASGPGAVQNSIAAFFPRYKSGPHKGQCNFNAQPLVKGAVTSFLITAVLTVK